MQCTQQSGDIMYVPTLWGHTTMNTKQSIGVAHEFSVEGFCMEQKGYVDLQQLNTIYSVILYTDIFDVCLEK